MQLAYALFRYRGRPDCHLIGRVYLVDLVVEFFVVVESQRAKLVVAVAVALSLSVKLPVIINAVVLTSKVPKRTCAFQTRKIDLTR